MRSEVEEGESRFDAYVPDLPDHYASTGSDLIASKAIEAGLSHLVLWLTLLGFVIGVVCSRMIQFISVRISE